MACRTTLRNQRLSNASAFVEMHYMRSAFAVALRRVLCHCKPVRLFALPQLFKYYIAANCSCLCTWLPMQMDADAYGCCTAYHVVVLPLQKQLVPLQFTSSTEALDVELHHYTYCQGISSC